MGRALVISAPKSEAVDLFSMTDAFELPVQVSGGVVGIAVVVFVGVFLLFSFDYMSHGGAVFRLPELECAAEVGGGWAEAEVLHAEASTEAPAKAQQAEIDKQEWNGIERRADDQPEDNVSSMGGHGPLRGW